MKSKSSKLVKVKETKPKPKSKPAAKTQTKPKTAPSAAAKARSKMGTQVQVKVAKSPTKPAKTKANLAKAVKLQTPKSKAQVAKPSAAKKSTSPKPSKAKSSNAAKVAGKTAKQVLVKPKAQAAKDVKKTVVKSTSKRGGEVVEKQIVKAASHPLVKSVTATAVSTKKRTLQVTQTASQSVSSPAAAASVVPQKPARASSRLAQVTVPSMAQAVASTAAKASYIPVQPSVVISSPLPSSVKKDAKLANNWKVKPVEQLSDAELQAMPDSEYMNAVQLAAFRLRLMALRRDILSNAGETTEHLREDTSVVPDPADRATIEEEHALELRTRDRERKLLKKIEQAIERIDANDYGYCDETGEPIGVGRLLARPTATLSLEAQQRRELKQKMFGD